MKFLILVLLFAAGSLHAHVFLLVPAQQYVGKFLATFKEFPPSQRPATFNLDSVMAQLQEGGGSK